MSIANVDETSQSRQEILELLPQGSVLHRYVQWACAVHGSPPIYHLGCGIATLLYELCWRGYRLPRIAEHGEYPLTAQFLLLGGSATGKSTAFHAVQDMARAVWDRTSTRPELDPWVELSGSVEGITSAIQSRYLEQHDNTPVILYDGEVSQAFARRDSLPEVFCKLVDGRSIQSNYRMKQRRKGANGANNDDQIVNPRINSIFCTTVAQLAPHFKESHRMGGIFPRLIWLKPRFKDGDLWLAQDHEGAQSLQTVRNGVISDWAGWTVQLELASNDFGKKFTFTAQAHDVLKNELFAKFRAAYTAETLDNNLHAVQMRLVEKARVFAALHAALRHDMCVVEDDMLFAVKLVRLFLAMHTMENGAQELGTDDDVRAAKRLELVLRASGDSGLTRRELYQKTRFSKGILDNAIAQVLDEEVVFVDNSQLDRPGRFLHVDSPLGMQLREVAAQQRRDEAELQQLTRERGVPTWRQRTGVTNKGSA